MKIGYEFITTVNSKNTMGYPPIDSLAQSASNGNTATNGDVLMFASIAQAIVALFSSFINIINMFNRAVNSADNVVKVVELNSDIYYKKESAVLNKELADLEKQLAESSAS